MLTKFKNNLKKFDLIDIKLLQLAAVCVAFVLAKLFPELLKIKHPIYIGLALLFAIRPVCKIFGNSSK